MQPLSSNWPERNVESLEKGLTTFSFFRPIIIASNQLYTSTKASDAMSWDRIEGQWKGKTVHHWGKMMSDELAAIAGKHEELVGRCQEKYGIAKEEAKRQVDEFKKIVEQLKKSMSAWI